MNPGSDSGMKLLFSIAILANAALIFWVELLFGKKLLPALGGSPAVWNTCLMFYQVLLLAGYGYALFLTRLTPRKQFALHTALLIAAMAAVPLSLFQWSDPAGTSPVLWLLALLAVSVGPPFFVLAAGAPLLQRWFSLSGHAEGGDPYFLYAASNLGSFAALAAYPVLLEPTFSLDDQSVLWKMSFVAVGALVIASGFVALRGARRAAGTLSPDAEAPSVVGVDAAGSDAVVGGDAAKSDAGDGGGGTGRAAARISAARRLRWVGLAFIPSSLLIGVTTHITSEVAPVPLIWVVPLGIYLLTFVVAFGPARRERERSGVAGAMAAAAEAPVFARQGARSTRRKWLYGGVIATGLLAAGIALANGAVPDAGWLLIAADLTVLLTAGLLCHTRVARDRPEPAHLAEYYLYLSLGGALGGVFNTLVAPVIFSDPLEYPLVLALFAFVAGSAAGKPAASIRPADVALGLLPALLAVGLPRAWEAVAPRFGWPGEAEPLLLLALAGALCLALAGRPARFGLGIAGLVFIGFTFPVTGQDVALTERTFFGIHRVYYEKERIWLAHGTTVHGGQDSREPTLPLTYYHPEGPAGSLFRGFYAGARNRAAGRIGVVGLGTGSLIAYARPGQRWTFFELDPTVVRIAEDARYFTFLANSGVPYRSVLGDARLSLEREREEGAARYDLLVVDAFSSDAIPVHLLTREAIALYLDRLAPDGWIVFHTSNRYADFSAMLGRLAADAGLRAYVGTDPLGDAEEGRYPSQWVILAREPVTLDDPRWRAPRLTDVRGWTDAYSSVFEVLRR